jgi:tRNA-Thr(GGU) m(6)t(6)A37 methyltransferase TsaA
MQEIVYRPIGVIHTPFKEPKGAPIQPVASGGTAGRAELLPEYEPGIKDLEGFSHVILLYHLHLSRGYDLQVTPFLDDELRGLFATRAPRRPNPIGLSVVRLERIEGHTLHVLDVDMVDGTPLLDVKPYAPTFRDVEEYRVGWLAGKNDEARRRKADDRFLR